MTACNIVEKIQIDWYEP